MQKRSAILIVYVLAASRLLIAQPENLQVVHGQTSCVQEGSKLTVEASDRAILHWDTFSIVKGEMTSFQLPHADAAVLNRVTGSMRSLIDGELLSNGHVYLINPQGVFIGSEGLVQTGAFLASTLDCANSDFLEGKQLLFVQGETPGVLRNEGRIETTHGDAILLAHTLQNEGSVETLHGHIAMAAGAELIFLPHGDEKIQIHLQLPSDERDWTSIGLHQNGKLHGGSIELDADGNLYGYAIKSDGVIDALQTDERDGSVVLFSEKGFIAHTGSIHGDEVHILGEHVRLLEHASIDVSRPDGGGVVLVGGDYQGKNPDVMNALSTFADEHTRISADALERGDGGKVILWADDATGSKGKISVRGGPQGGDGGFVEVSGKQMLDFWSEVDAGAPLGKNGMLLLDPTNVTIAANGGVNTGATFNNCPIGTYTNTAATATLDNTFLSTQLGSCNITVTTVSGQASAGTMAVNGAISWSSANSLTITSTTTLISNASGTLTSTGGGAINLNAGTALTIGAAISWSGTSVATSTLSAGNGALAVNANVTNGTTGGTLNMTATTTLNSAGAATILTNGGGVTNLTAGTTMALSGAFTWSGTTSATSTLNANSTLTLNNVTNSTTAGNLTINGGVTTSSVLTVSAATTVSHSSSGTLTMTSATAGSDMTINGVVNVTNGNLSISLSDDFTLAAAPAALTFNSTGTFTYATTTATNPVTTINGPVTIGGVGNWSSVLGTITFNSGSSLTTTGTGATTMTSTGAFSFAAGSTISYGSTGAFSLTGSALTVSTPLTVSCNALSLNASAGILTASMNVIQNRPAGTMSFSSTAAMNLTGNVENNSLTGTTTLNGGTTTGTITIGASGTHFNHTSSSGAMSITASGAGSDLVVTGALNVTGVNLPIIVDDDVTITATTGSINYTGPGTFSISTTAATSVILVNGSVAITNNGIVNWNASAGGITTAAGSAFSISGSGNLTFNAGTTITIGDSFTRSGTGNGTFTAAGVLSTGAAANFQYTSTGDLSWTSTASDITLNGTVNITQANATFFPSDDFTLTATTGFLTFFSPQPKLLWIRTGPTTSTLLSGTVTIGSMGVGGNALIEANDDITISVTTGNFTYDAVGGSLTFNAAGGVDPDFLLNGTLTVLNGSMSATSFDDITFAAGSTFNYSSSSPLTLTASPIVGTTPSINLNGNATISNGALTMTANQDINFALGGVTTYTSPLPWNMTASTGNITIGGTVSLATSASWSMVSGAALAVNNQVRNTAAGSITALVGTNCSIGFSTNTVPAQFGTAGGVMQLTVGQNLFVVSSETTTGSTSLLGFSPGGQGTISIRTGGVTAIDANRNQDASIQSPTSLTLTAGGDLTLSTDPFAGQLGQAFIQTQGALSITANDVTLSGSDTGGSAFIETSSGKATIISNVSTALNENSYMRNTGSGNLVVVVDEQAPLPPEVGSGQFNLGTTAFLSTNGGDLSIFTALPAQNTVLGLMNGASLAQGFHVFGVWYSTGGIDPPPFTIFYKEGSGAEFNFFSSAIAEMIQEYFDRSMGWQWVSNYWSCDLAERSAGEESIYYRKAFEYPLDEPPPISPCEEEPVLSKPTVKRLLRLQ